MLRQIVVAIDQLRVEHVTDRYVGWLNDPEVTRFTEVSPGQTRADVERYVRDAESDPNAGMWRVLANGQHVGNIRLSAIVWRHRRAEVAIVIGEKSMWGRGIATQAIRLLTGHAFGELSLHRLEAGFYPGNDASIRAFSKAGFVVEGIRKHHLMHDGEPLDCLMMAKVHGQ